MVVVAAALLALPAIALGDDRDDREERRESSARLEASGRGTLRLEGRLVAFGAIARRGRLVVIDRSRDRDATATLGGKTLDFDRRGRLRVNRAKGRFFIEGSMMRVTIGSGRLSVSVAGMGRVRFRGSGFYRLNNQRARRWTRRWIPIQPPPPPRDRRRDDETIAGDSGSGDGGPPGRRVGAPGGAPARA